MLLAAATTFLRRGAVSHRCHFHDRVSLSTYATEKVPRSWTRAAGAGSGLGQNASTAPRASESRTPHPMSSSVRSAGDLS